MAKHRLPGIVVQDVGDAEITPGVQGAVALGNLTQAAEDRLRDCVGQPAPREELDDLIVEREWFDQEFPQRIAAAVREHRRRHEKDPSLIRLPKKFADWILRCKGTRLTFEIPPEPVAIYLAGSAEKASQLVIEMLTMEVIAPRFGYDGIGIRLESSQSTDEADVRCYHCSKVFPFLPSKAVDYVTCPHCRKTLVIKYADGLVVVSPYQRTDIP